MALGGMFGAYALSDAAEANATDSGRSRTEVRTPTLRWPWPSLERRLVMRPYGFLTAVLSPLLFVACSDQGARFSALPTEPLLARPAASPTTTFKFPLADAALALQSDHKYSAGTYSVYDASSCGESTALFTGP